MDKKFQPQDLAALLAQQQGLSQKEALEFVRAFFNLTEEALIKDSFVKVSGFGTTKLVSVNERESVNISTGERFQIGKHTKISFTPDVTLRDLVNRPFAMLTTTTLYDETPEEELDAVPSLEGDLGEEEVIDETSSSENFDEIETTCIIIDTDSEGSGDTLNEDKEKAETPQLNTKIVASNIPEDADTPTKQSTITAIGLEAEQEHSPRNTEEEQEIVIIETSQETVSSDIEGIEPTTVNQHMAKPVQQPIPASKASTPHVTNIQGELHVKTEEISTKHQSRNTRFNILLIAFVALLVILSYFAGYYHWLCPNCPNIHATFVLTTPNAVVATPASKNSTSLRKGSIKATPQISSAQQVVSSQEDSAKNKFSPSQLPASASVAPITPTSNSNKIEQPTKVIIKSSALTAQEKSSWAQKAQHHQQLPHGKSQIVGTYATHLVKAGDSLPRLAKHYYGNANYVKYIVLYNHIDNPDVIKVGQRIKLPQLLQE